ncbi:SU10 major capsid protein [Nocardiopsis oceani]
MPGIVGQGTTFNLPNYVGELLATTPQDTPFLSAIGGLTGGVSTDSTLFAWSTYDLRDPDHERQRLEGGDAPAPTARTRQRVRNVVEIHQEVLEVSYTKQAATGQLGGTGSNHPHGDALGGATNPVMDEVDWQVRQHLVQIARDVEVGFILGEFQEPSDNESPRRTRGLMEAIETNAIDADGEQLSENGGEVLLDLMQQVWESGGILEQETATIMVSGTQKRHLTNAFITQGNYREASRTVGGVRVDTVMTDFGELNVMLNRYVPSDTAIVTSLEQCAPRFLAIPGKGHFFVEELAKVGSADRYQIYGEIGLEYGNEAAHGKIEGLSTSSPSNGNGS